MDTTAARGFFSTGIGKKYLMGITGLVWAGFVLVHMAGNLLILVSANAYNAYGHAITSGNIVYVAEAVLIVALIVHVYCAVTLTMENRRARGPGAYAFPTNGAKAVRRASKTMGIQGSIVLAFIITHLATFKYGTYYEATVNGVVMRDLHRLILDVFHQPGYVAWYVVALVFLGIHLSHGVYSSVQSLGIRNERMACAVKNGAIAYAVIVSLGFIVQPIYVYFIAG